MMMRRRRDHREEGHRRSTWLRVHRGRTKMIRRQKMTKKQ